MFTLLRQFRQLVGCYCSYLLARQDGGTSQIFVNGFKPPILMGHPVVRPSLLRVAHCPTFENSTISIWVNRPQVQMFEQHAAP